MEQERFAWKCLLHALKPYGPPEVWQSSFGPDMETALSEEEQAFLRRASGIVAGTAKLDASEGGLLSIFDLLDGGTPGRMFRPDAVERFQCPEEQAVRPAEKQERMQRCLEGLKAADGRIEPALEVCRQQLSYYPSGIPGVSLYQKARLEVCLACCMREAGLESPFLLVSCGLPGIQKFLYTISGKGVLKSLRSRSFYLDLLEEHLMTELLDRLHLCRAHRLYVGGGSSYAVLPNTDRTRETLEACLRSVNQWLLKRFSGALQFLYAWEPCSGPQLKNEGGTAYQEIFARLENKLNQKRNRRFDASGLTWLNSQKMSDPERECRVCAGSSLPLDGDDLCPVCREFRDSSSGLAATGKVAAVCRAVWEEGGTPLTLPSLDGQDWFVYMMDRAQADRLRAEQPGTVVRVYAPGGGGNADIPLPLGAYAYTIDEKMATFESLAACSQGIRRLGVLRADVDNLGRAFVRGFHRRLQSGETGSGLPLTASLSQQLTQFFKVHLQTILQGTEGPVDPFHLVWNEAGKRSPRKAIVVYAGGDDLFIVGAWNEIVELSVDLYRAFRGFTGGRLTFSAGIGLFSPHYPLYAMAEDTAILEDAAKGIDAGKNGLALFGLELLPDAGGSVRHVARHLYHWDTFIEEVVTEKLYLLERYFEMDRKEQNGRGSSFLYRLKNYAEQLDRTPGQTINVARFAYLLARMEPKKDKRELSDLYHEFSTKLYQWIKDAESRRQLLTAMELYLSLIRTSQEKGEEQPYGE